MTHLVRHSTMVIIGVLGECSGGEETVSLETFEQ